ncbi:hypothetical protein HII31_10391 [Pseudocercospora fuligena]|uniref:Uncharacterized protein n=1 Tax=Pseudocercospora fuligena TaxID=685502 RepID=A0A8H6RCY0_9PEZI|nr:hypothetical protein HII31_10391 [Pseudocercospora fuligena]
MDTTTFHSLLYRNGELEAELRSVKKQLADALNANHFLLTRISTPSTDTYSERNARLQEKYEAAIQENVRLKAQLGLTPRITPKRRIGIRPPQHRRRDSVASISEASREGTQATAEELLSFEEDDTSALETNLRPPASYGTVTTLTPKKPEQKKDTVGLGIANSFSSASPNTDTNTDSFDQDTSPPIPQRKQHGFEIKYGDGTSSFIPTPITTPSSTFSHAPMEPQPVVPLPFHNAEHMRMMGMACFLEDQTPGERARAWHGYAVRHPRHTGSEYIEYYEEVIRPAYLEKMKAREQVQEVVNLATTSPQTEAGAEPEQENGEVSDQELQASNETVKASVNEAQPSETAFVWPKPADPASLDHLTVITAKEDLALAAEPADADALKTPEVGVEVPHQLALSMYAEHKAPQEVQHSVESRFEHRDRALDQRPRFMPNPGPQELEELFATAHPESIHAYRAVTISNIPKSATLHDVLSNIRSGKIFSATLHETAGFRTNPPISTNTITLTFTSGKDTKSFIDSCSTNPIFTLPTSNTTFHAIVTLIPTITRPLTSWIISKMKEDNLSRVLYIHDPEKTFPLDRVVEEMMRGGAKKPLKESFDEEVPGLMLFEFASIQEAANARGAMEKNFDFFREISRDFATDPCAKAKGGEDEGEGAGLGGKEGLEESEIEIEREEEAKMMEG